MDTKKEEEIIEKYISGQQTGQDNQLRAAAASLQAKKTNDLTIAILKHQHQISETGLEIKKTIDTKVDALIQSNKKLADDGDRLARANFILSIAVFFIGWMGLVTQIFQTNYPENIKWTIFTIITIALLILIWWVSRKIFKNEPR